MFSSTIFKLSFLSLTVLLFSSCENSENTSNTDLEKEKLALEKEKLELEKSKLKQSEDSLANKQNETPAETGVINSGNSKSVKAEYKYLLGTWTGKLRDKKLSIVLENIENNIVSGYNIAGSNKRAVKGMIYPDDRKGDGECLYDGNSFKLVLSEPGDDKWDGVFTIYLNTCQSVDDNENVTGWNYSGQGKWKSNNGKMSGDIVLSK
jgi:hypothetical protein